MKPERGELSINDPTQIGYLLDLDGTVYRGERLLRGADTAIDVLRSRGRRLLFVSNKPLHSRADYAEKLTRLGIPASEEDVLTSSYVLAISLSNRHPGARVFVIGEPPLLRELERVGLQPCADPLRIDYVVAAFDRTLTYEKLNIGFQALRAGARFVATNADRTCPVDDGEVPDAAGVIAALEATSGRKLEEVFGKPSTAMVDVALARLKLPPEQCSMIGDRLETDVTMANDHGLNSILTLTGVTSWTLLEASAIRPDFVIEQLPEICELDRVLEQHLPCRPDACVSRELPSRRRTKAGDDPA